MMTHERFSHYVLGNDEFDREHWSLFQLADSVIISLKSDNLVGAIEQLKILLDFIMSHVCRENQYMLDNHYPFIDSHLIANQLLIDTVKLVMLKTNTELFSPYDLKEFECVLVNHIDNYDRQMISYFNEV